LEDILRREKNQAMAKVHGIIRKQGNDMEPRSKHLGEVASREAKTRGQSSTVHFQFHKDGKGTAAVMKAVAAAEHAVTKSEGVAATSYKFNLMRGAMPIEETQDVELGESGDVRSKRQSSPRQGAMRTAHPSRLSPVTWMLQERMTKKKRQLTMKDVHRMNDPVAAQLKTNALRQMYETQAEKQRCNRYKNAVAHFCGRMVDCVTKNLEQHDIHYSRALVKQAHAFLPSSRKPSGVKTKIPVRKMHSKDKIPVALSQADERWLRGPIKPRGTADNGNNNAVASRSVPEVYHRVTSKKAALSRAAREQQEGAGLFSHGKHVEQQEGAGLFSHGKHVGKP